MVQDRQLVLDNIYLMRLKEMYPDAQVTCSDHIQNLIDAYMRRNMVQQEIMEELALEKLKKTITGVLELMVSGANSC